jgi:phospholipid/cholesterol/gamma-HCH transport system permease protein
MRTTSPRHPRPKALTGSAQRRRVELPEFLGELGGIARLGGETLARGVRRPITWAPEFITQFRLSLKATFGPLLIMSFALSFGPAGIQASNFLGLFGALDRLGAAYELINVRELAPLVTAIIVAGVAGTAICADLGARRVREEIDALEVLGIDPVRNIVAPRLLALITLSLLYNVFALIAGMVGAFVVVIQNHAPIGPFISSFLANATTLEFGAALLKTGVYGLTIGVVSCYKGLYASGGAAGVGKAVNQSVVITFLLIGAIDYAFTQLLLATHPILSTPR